MNVAILVKEFPPNVIGGTETQTQRMARNLATSGHDVTVYTKSYPESPDSDEPFTLKRLPTWHFSPFASTLTFVISATLYLLVRGRHHDVLQCMMIYPNGFVGYIVSAVTGLPYFAWIRGGDYYFMKENPVKRWMIRRVLSDTTVLVQTERIAEDVKSEFDPSDLQILGNGVDVPEAAASGDAIVFVGRLKRQKGVHVLLEAADGLPSPEQLLIVGEGPKGECLKSRAGNFDLTAEFVGEVSPTAVTEYLQRGKVFVLPAVQGEGLPNAVLEAMAIGLPVIVTDTGGVADAVVEGETGYIVEPGNVDELRDRLDRLCSDDEYRGSMGKAAREHVQHEHSWQRLLDELEGVYDHVTVEREQG